MPIAYYAQDADEAHWGSLWQRQQFDHLLAVAARDPLSQHLEAHLPRAGLILEGGCGLGQYVLFFRERGYRAIGGDFSLGALQTHRCLNAESPLVGLDLRRLPFADQTLQAHISLGVVEHLEEGPQALLVEFYRTLAPGGSLLLSVPWLNHARRIFAPLIRRRQGRRQAAGARFYQYAFSRREICEFLSEAGFTVRRFYPYSPGKGVREIAHLFSISRAARETPSDHPVTSTVAQRPISPLRSLLYSPLLLPTFAHMVLVVAQKYSLGS